MSRQPRQLTFSSYEKFVITLLAFLQFTIVLDFMILGPLGPFLLRDLQLTTSQFSRVVSAYAWSAGAFGMLAAGFADRFDRKRLLVFFYSGFLLGTLLCGVAWSYPILLVARVITGLFAGVIGSITMAIVADLFPIEVRGRVMGTVQTAFAASQVLGIPIGVSLSNLWGWHAPFLMIVAVSSLVGLLIVFRLRPINAHLALQSKASSFRHLLSTVRQGRYLRTFSATMLLATGGYMLMPFGSTFTVYNLGVAFDHLPLVYVITGAATFVAAPLVGRLSDSFGKYRTFCVGTIAGMVLVATYCNLGITPLALVIALNTALFIAITTRMVSATALISAVPDAADRGAFMAVNSSMQQLAGGLAAAFSGLIVTQSSDGRLAHYDVLGYVVMLAMAIVMALMYPIHRNVMLKTSRPATA